MKKNGPNIARLKYSVGELLECRKRVSVYLGRISALKFLRYVRKILAYDNNTTSK